MLSPRTLRGRKRRHHRARLALVVAVLGILSVLVVRGIVLLWQGSGIVTANESPLSPLHYRPQSPDVLRIALSPSVMGHLRRTPMFGVTRKPKSEYRDEEEGPATTPKHRR